MPKLSQSSIDQQQYIPQPIQQAMNQHIQNTMPSHLQRYVGTDGYVPSHAQKAIVDHMQKTMPSHLKQYSGAYMEQHIVNPTSATVTNSATPLKPRPPVPNLMRQDHSNVPGEQFEASFHDNLFAPDSAAESTSQPQATGGSPPSPQPTEVQPVSPQPSEFGFIMEPPKPPKRSLLPSGASLPIRLAIIFGGLLVVFVIFAIIKSFLGGNSNIPSLVSITQNQQELVHLATNASQQRGLSVTNQNFAITTQLSLTSDQSQLVVYLKNNGKKVNAKTLNLKVSTSTDQQLTAAAANSSYDQTFHQIMQNKLTSYRQALKQAFSQTKGPKGQQLLNNEYQAAGLLLQQLDSPAS